ncbi:MAG: phosphotransferase, partial [Bacteroidetes bacterium]|nr:phosphotransferase [Bacteroidota bacterium]
MLSAKTTCKLIRAGINHTYLVSDEDRKFVFRIYSFQWRTPEEINEEIRLLLLLKEHQLSISYPIADKEDNYIQTLEAPEGTRYAVMFSYAEGEKLHLIPADTHYKIGVVMGKLHQVTQGLTLNREIYNEKVLLIDSLKKIEEFLPSQTEEMIYMK